MQPLTRNPPPLHLLTPKEAAPSLTRGHSATNHRGPIGLYPMPWPYTLALTFYPAPGPSPGPMPNTLAIYPMPWPLPYALGSIPYTLALEPMHWPLPSPLASVPATPLPLSGGHPDTHQAPLALTPTRRRHPAHQAPGRGRPWLAPRHSGRVQGY